MHNSDPLKQIGLKIYYLFYFHQSVSLAIENDSSKLLQHSVEFNNFPAPHVKLRCEFELWTQWETYSVDANKTILQADRPNLLESYY